MKAKTHGFGLRSLGLRRLGKVLRGRLRSPLPSEAHLFNLADLNRRPRTQNEAKIRRLCANAYLGDDTSLCRVLGRYKMFVDTTDVGLSSHLLLDGYWEMWITQVVAATVKPGMVAVDVGANLGYYTVLMADLCGVNGAVHAFEPNPALCRRLAKTLSINGFTRRTQLHPFALSDRQDQAMTLVVPRNEPMNGYMVGAAQVAPGEGVVVESQRLDAVAGLDLVDVVKIDADTAERRIWRGMSGLLASRRSMTVFLEFAAARYEAPGDFLDEITHHGFTLSVADPFDGVQPRTRAQILGAPAVVDQMLVLTR